MVTMGALTAARGGDLEDIALSMGTAYLGSSAGAGFTNSISSTFSSSFIEAGVNETFATVASDSITKGLINGTISEVRGGSFEDGFAGGAVGGLVQGGVGEVADFVKPDIIDLAMDSGLDLRDATSVFKSGVRAVSSGVASEITGKGDFATSFTNSVVGSTVTAGVNSVNSTIDEQFNSVASGWDKDGEKVDTTVTGAGIPDDLVSEVKVSDIGIDTTAPASTFDAASVLDNTFNRDTDTGVAADDSPQASVTVAQAPTGETTSDFQDLLSSTGATSDNTVLADTPVKVLDDVADIAETVPVDDAVAVPVADSTPTGGLASVSESLPVDSGQSTSVVSDAPIAGNLLTAGLAQDQPSGGLNAVSQTTPQNKTDSLMGFKATDITKPLVATVGNLVKSTLTKPKTPTKPVGGLQTASVRPKTSAPPAKVDVASLIPIQKAPPVKKPTTVGPAKTLASNATLTPVSNIAGLTSLVKKVG